jgi:hypothetical protein
VSRDPVGVALGLRAERGHPRRHVAGDPRSAERLPAGENVRLVEDDVAHLLDAERLRPPGRKDHQVALLALERALSGLESRGSVRERARDRDERRHEDGEDGESAPRHESKLALSIEDRVTSALARH